MFAINEILSMFDDALQHKRLNHLGQEARVEAGLDFSAEGWRGVGQRLKKTDKLNHTYWCTSDLNQLYLGNNSQLRHL